MGELLDPIDEQSDPSMSPPMFFQSCFDFLTTGDFEIEYPYVNDDLLEESISDFLSSD